MSTLEFKLYDLLTAKLGQAEAAGIVEFIHQQAKEEIEDQTKILATKEDIYRLDVKISETKTDLLKWFIGLFIALALMVIGLYIKK